MIISYVWVLETNTGATWRVSSLRIVCIIPMVVSLSHIIAQVGTLLGALYGYIVSDVSFFCRTFPLQLSFVFSRPG